MKRRRDPSVEDRALWRVVTRGVRPMRTRPPVTPPEQPVAEVVPETAREKAPEPRKRSTPGASTGASTLTAMDRVLAQKGLKPETIPYKPGPAHLVAGNTPGVDKRQSDRVRKGRAGIEARIDLHGMGRDAAHTALIDFILKAHASGLRTVLVITGKGRYTRHDDDAGHEPHAPRRGLLQTMAPRWLNDAPIRERVIGFHSAQPRHGGSGAIYVMLKRAGK